MHKKNIILILFLLIVGFVVYFFFFKIDRSIVFDTAAVKTPEVGGAPKTQTATGSKYSHSDPVFSFEYPEGYAPSFIEEETGDSIIVSRGGDSLAGFQIFVTPFDEPNIELTPNRIQNDIPDIVMKNPETIALPNGIKALSFVSRHESLGDTFEVWFVKDGYAYQFSSTREGVEGLDKALATIEWK
jgi:hypothetical protein